MNRTTGVSPWVSIVLIEERIASAPVERADFLERFIDGFDYRNAPNSEKLKEIVDNLITFIVAGHETTALGLSWGLQAASYFPEAQQKVAEETKLPIGERVHTLSLWNEIIRLYPPAPILGRDYKKDTKIGEFDIKRNDSVIIPIIAIHRHVDLWEAPLEFIPDRFVGFKPKQMAFLPYSYGPRVCIGAQLANIEAVIILGEFFKRFRLEPNDFVPEPSSTITLRSRNGMVLNLRRVN